MATTPTHAYCPECHSPAVATKRGVYVTHRRNLPTMYTRQSRTERCPASGTVATEASVARWVAWELGSAANTAENCARVLADLRAGLARAEAADAEARSRLAAITAIAASRGTTA